MRRLNHIPGPAGQPMIGSLVPYTRDRNAFLRAALGAHGDVCRLRFPVRDVVLLGHPDDAARYLNDTSGDFQKLGYRLPFRNAFGGIAFQEGERFKEKRSSMVSIFSGTSLARIFGRVADTVYSGLDTEIAAARSDDIVDLQQVMSRLLLRGLLSALLSEDLSPPQLRTIDEGVRFAMAFFGFIRLTGGPPPLLGPGRLPPTAVARLYRTVSAQVRSRRSAATEHDDVTGALLALRPRDGLPMDDLAITNELVLLLSASYGSTVASLAHTFARVLGSPPATARMHEECAGFDPADRSLESVRGMTWAKACFEESLRLQGSAPLLRIAATHSTAHGFGIPKGTPMVFPLAVIHRDPRWWPDPDEFDPTRFYDPAPRGARPSLAYLPFGAGPHRCVASQLAYALAQYLLPTMLQRFEVTLLPGWSITEVPGLAPKIKGGLPVRLVPRRVGGRTG